MEFGVPVDFENRRRQDHETFYCPAGHSLSFLEKNETETLREALAHKDRLLAEEQRRREFERNGRLAAEREKTRAKNRLKKFTHRVHCGVCPHCQRTFKQLAAHMASKHPDAK